jgi:hypothetical protein
VKLKVVTAGDHCFVRMLSKENGEWLLHWLEGYSLIMLLKHLRDIALHEQTLVKT